MAPTRAARLGHQVGGQLSLDEQGRAFWRSEAGIVCLDTGVDLPWEPRLVSDRRVDNLAVSPDGRMLAVVDGQGLYLVDIIPSEYRVQLEHPRLVVPVEVLRRTVGVRDPEAEVAVSGPLQWSPDSRRLAWAVYRGGMDLDDSAVLCLSVADGRLSVVGEGRSRRVGVYGTPGWLGPEGLVMSYPLQPSEPADTLASTSPSKPHCAPSHRLKVVDLRTGTTVATFACPGPPGAFVAFPGGRAAHWNSNRRVLLDAAGRELCIIPGDGGLPLDGGRWLNWEPDEMEPMLWHVRLTGPSGAPAQQWRTDLRPESGFHELPMAAAGPGLAVWAARDEGTGETHVCVLRGE